jgi:WD40 repeat protein/serine/threonine protein kinase
MIPEPHNAVDAEPSLDEVLAAYLKAQERGQPTPREELLARHPALAAELAEFFADFERVEGLVVPLRALRQAAAAQRASPAQVGAGDSAEPSQRPSLEKLGDYRIVREIGRGGMGVVYEAEQESLGRHVALKVLPAHSLLDPKFLERFRREAKAAAKLHHTNIVPVFGFGEADGVPYYAMQFIRGEGLDKVVADLRRFRDAGAATPQDGTAAQGLLSGRFAAPQAAAETAETVRLPNTTNAGSASTLTGSPTFSEYHRSVAQVGVQVAEALAYAHAQGVLHRDIKPSNLLLDAQGRVWITDFGLAKVDNVAELTGPGEVVGTLPFMAPERFDGHSLRQSDIYSLGLTLYELLTLRRAFQDAIKERLIAKVLHQQPPPPRQIESRVPRDLETVVLKCIAREIGDRYEFAGEVAEDLRRFLDDRPVRARRSSAAERLVRWCRRNPALTLATGLAAAALLAVSVLSIVWAVRETIHGEKLERALNDTRARHAENQFDHGLALCERGDVGAGLLWLGRALETAPAGADDLRAVIRAQLAGWQRRLIPLKACLESAATVTAAALSPDGATVWAAGVDGRLRRWNVANRKLLGPPTPVPAVVRAVAWGPGGKVLTVCQGGTVQLWNAVAGTYVALALPREVVSAAWDPGGQYFVTGGTDGSVSFRNADGSASARPGFCQASKVLVLAVSPDGKGILTGDGKNARLWDVGGGEAKLLPHPGEVRAAAFNPDGRTVQTSCANDLATRSWDTATGNLAGEPNRHKGTVEAFAYSPTGGAFVTGGRDRMARVWSVTTNQVLGQPLPHDTVVPALGLSSDGRTLLTVGIGQRTLRVWDVALDRSLGHALGHGDVVRAVGFLPRTGTVFTAGHDGMVRFWDGATHAAAGRPPRNAQGPVMAVNVSSDGKRMLVRCWAPTAWLWDPAAPGPAGMPLIHPPGVGWVRSAALSPDGETVLTGCANGSVRFWDTATATPRTGNRSHAGTVHAAAFSADGQMAATGGNDGDVWRWDVRTGRTSGERLRHDGPVRSLAFSPGGEMLLTTSDDHRARLWDVRSGALREPELQHAGTVRAAAFSPDGRTIVTASEDGTARLWDVATGRPRSGALVHDDRVVAVAFSPDGQTVLTGSEDGTARLWDVTTGKSLGPPLAHAGAVWAVAFSPDGQTVLTGSADGTARLWPVPWPEAQTPDRITLQLQLFTGLSLDALDTLHVLDAAGWDERSRQLRD